MSDPAIGVAPTDRNTIVHLNVGGELFTTRLGTLTDIQGSYFSHLLSGRFCTAYDLEQCYFIDRDPTLFRICLNYLRNRTLHIQQGIEHLHLYEALLGEAVFFNIDPLIADVKALIDEFRQAKVVPAVAPRFPSRSASPDRASAARADRSAAPSPARHRLVQDGLRFDDWDF